MAQHNDTGRQGEDRALQHLLALGYQLRHRNWRHSRDLELDLVMVENTELVIVEVKTVTKAGDFQGEDRLSAAKCRKLVEAARAYEALEAWDGPIRFDIVVVQGHALRHHRDVDVVAMARA